MSYKIKSYFKTIRNPKMGYAKLLASDQWSFNGSWVKIWHVSKVWTDEFFKGGRFYALINGKRLRCIELIFFVGLKWCVQSDSEVRFRLTRQKIEKIDIFFHSLSFLMLKNDFFFGHFRLTGTFETRSMTQFNSLLTSYKRN